MSTTIDAGLAYDAPPADILTRAAEVIEANGRARGSYFDRDYRVRGTQAWTPDTPCCAAGALGLALGLDNEWDVENAVVPAVGNAMRDHEPPHPAMAALMAHLGVDSVNAVFTWSDEHEAGEIARVMRECADSLRPRLTLDEARDAIGRSVVYRPHPDAEPEVGTIAGTSSLYVFVQYVGERGTKATPAELLTFEVGA